MSQLIRFGTHGPALHAAGWNVIPIPEGRKAPLIKGWNAGFDMAQIAAFAAKSYAQGNIGLLAREFPAVDIDVVEEKCAAAIEQHALRILGSAPVRYSGAGPKRLLTYTTAVPFSKLKVFLSGPDGDRGLLGHTQIKTTQRYAHLSHDTLLDATNSVNSAVGGRFVPMVSASPAVQVQLVQ